MDFKTEITKQKCVETAVVLSAVLLFFGWKYEDWNYVIATIFILIISLLIPILFYPIAKLWFALGTALGFISTNVLLTLIFFLVVTPIGLLRKMLGKDSLNLTSFKKSVSSVFKVRNHQFSPEDLKNPY
ncbi:MAG: SxtJ family membrane protein [Bacteroidota bacterium]